MSAPASTRPRAHAPMIHDVTADAVRVTAEDDFTSLRIVDGDGMFAPAVANLMPPSATSGRRDRAEAELVAFGEEIARAARRAGAARRTALRRRLLDEALATIADRSPSIPGLAGAR